MAHVPAVSMHATTVTLFMLYLTVSAVPLPTATPSHTPPDLPITSTPSPLVPSPTPPASSPSGLLASVLHAPTPTHSSVPNPDRTPDAVPQVVANMSTHTSVSVAPSDSNLPPHTVSPNPVDTLRDGKTRDDNTRDDKTRQDTALSTDVASDPSSKRSAPDGSSVNTTAPSNSSSKTPLNATPPSGNGTTNSTTVKEDEQYIGNMSTADMIKEARAQKGRLLKGGFIELIEWLFVFILVAPGTFPAIGCVLLTCASFWRRRLGNTGAGNEVPTAMLPNGSRQEWGSPTGYHRVPLADHSALVARTRG